MSQNNVDKRIPPADASDIPLAEMDPNVSVDVRKFHFVFMMYFFMF